MQMNLLITTETVAEEREQLFPELQVQGQWVPT